MSTSDWGAGHFEDGTVAVLDVVRERTSSLGVEQLVKQTAAKDAVTAARHEAPLYIRMEQEPGSSGVSLIDHYLRTVVAGFNFAGVRPTGAKAIRAAPVAALAEAGHLHLLRAPWKDAFLDELCAFPVAGHDDQVDALAGAFQCLVEESSYFEEQIIEHDPLDDVFVNRTTGKIFAPPWPRRPGRISPF